mgnify:CR=1 FL=1
MTVRLPDLVDLNEQDLQGQDPDGGVEYIVSFDTTLVKYLLTEILSLTSCAIFRFQTSTTKEPPKAPMVAADGAEERF